MARRDVIEITCDRCGKTETQSSTEAPKQGAPEIQATFHDEKVTYNDLCKRCREAVKGYFTRITKKVDDQAPAAAPTVQVVHTPPLHPEVKDEKKKGGFLGGR